MSLSDQEIAVLVKKANACAVRVEVHLTGHQRLAFAERALKYYNRILQNTSPHPLYLYNRAIVKHDLAYASALHSFKETIEDLNKAIELDPDRASYYYKRGGFLLEELTLNRTVTGESRDNLIERIIADYRLALEKDPADPDTWLNLLEVNLLLRRWDEAVGIYGACKQYIGEKDNRLVRSWLGCLALLFAGDPLEKEDMDLLSDEEVKIYLDNRVWRVSLFLDEIRNKQENNGKWVEMNRIHKLFIRHLKARAAKLLEKLTGPWQRDGYDETQKSLEMAFALKSEDVEPLFEMALAEYSKEDSEELIIPFEQALDEYRKIVQQNPMDSSGWYTLGAIFHCLAVQGGMLYKEHEGLKPYEEALNAYNKTINLNPHDVLAWYNKAVVLSHLDLQSEALIAFDKVIELSKDNKELTSLTSMAWCKKGDTLKYVKTQKLEKLLTEVMFPEHKPFEVYYDARGQVLILKRNEFVMTEDGNFTLNKRKEVMLEEEKEALINLSTDIVYKEAVEKLFLKSQHWYEESLEAYEKALELIPNFSDSWWRKAQLSETNPQEALKVYDRVIDAHPYYTRFSGLFYEILKSKTRMLEMLKRDEELLSVCDLIIGNSNEYLNEFYGNRGQVLERLGCMEEALEDYNKEISLNEGFAKYVGYDVFGYIGKGRVFAKLGRYKESLEAYRAAEERVRAEQQRHSGYLITVRFSKGDSLIILKRYDEAIKVYNEMTVTWPNMGGTWYGRAEAYSMKGGTSYKKEVLRDLSKAISFDAQLRELAKQESAFKPFRDDKDFQALVED